MGAPEYITLGLAGVAAVVWLIRLEGRVNTAEKVNSTAMADCDREQAALKAAFIAFQAEAKVAEKAHSETAIEIVRLQEQIKHLTDLIERMVAPPPAPRRRTTGG